jgi:hypothetical protein
MSLDKKILSEIKRYRSIDKYIAEQAGEDLGALAPEAGAVPPPPPSEATATPPPPPGDAAPTPIDVENDPDVEKIDNDGKSEEGTDEESGSEELDITELVTAQKEIQTKQDDYFENLFGQLNKLESKLSEMDVIMNKLNALENKIEKYRDKTPQEKLELRSLDSGPFNQKLSDFFEDKEEDMEKSGKNEYILTQDEVEDFSPNEIKKTFRNFEDSIPSKGGFQKIA